MSAPRNWRDEPRGPTSETMRARSVQGAYSSGAEREHGYDLRQGIATAETPAAAHACNCIGCCSRCGTCRTWHGHTADYCDLLVRQGTERAVSARRHA